MIVDIFEAMFRWGRRAVYAVFALFFIVGLLLAGLAGSLKERGASANESFYENQARRERAADRLIELERERTLAREGWGASREGRARYMRGGDVDPNGEYVGGWQERDMTSSYSENSR